MDKMWDAVLFDLDGTLWDSSREVLHCWNRVLQPLGRRVTEEQMAQLMGLIPREIGDLMFPDLAAEERYALTYRCLDAEPPYLFERGAKLYPGVRRTLGELHDRGWLMGINTNKPSFATHAILEHFGIARYFGADLVQRLGLMPALLDRLFGAGGIWEVK